MEKAEKYFSDFIALDSVRHYYRLAADSGQQAVLNTKGEDYLTKLHYIDSANFYYQFVADSFPNSHYKPQAEYAMIWLFDEYETPGDSILIDMYANFVDSFPNTEFTEAIVKEYKIRPSQEIIEKQKEEDGEGEEEDSLADSDSTATADGDQAADTAATQNPFEKFALGPNGERIPPANNLLVAEKISFKYPIEAVHLEFEGKLYFNIRIDFSGEVSEAVLRNPTESEELNQAVRDVIENSTFDIARIPPELYDSWFYYVYTVRLPQEYRR
jgi:hypothetical protein